MKRKLIVICLLFLIFLSSGSYQRSSPVNMVFANTKHTELKTTDLVIVNTARLLAKIFIQAIDFEEFKKKQMKAIAKKSEKDFNRRFREFYAEIKDTELVAITNIPVDLSKDAALKRIAVLQEQDILNLIDAAPDYIIIQKIKKYFKKRKREKHGQNIIEWTTELFKALPSKSSAQSQP